MAAGSCDELIICVITYPVDYAAARAWGRGRGWKMEAVQEEGDVSEVFLSLGPPEEALEHRPRVPRERRALGLGQPEVEAREREPGALKYSLPQVLFGVDWSTSLATSRRAVYVRIAPLAHAPRGA